VDPLVTAFDTATAAEVAEKFYVFHQRHFWKSADVEEDASSAEYAVIATSHSQENACVMSKGVSQPVNQTSRQANSEVAASNTRISHDPTDLIQTL
jgi:hypothetical protein